MASEFEINVSGKSPAQKIWIQKGKIRGRRKVEWNRIETRKTHPIFVAFSFENIQNRVPSSSSLIWTQQNIKMLELFIFVSKIYWFLFEHEKLHFVLKYTQ